MSDQTPTTSKEQALANFGASIHLLREAGFKAGATVLRPHNIPIVVVEGTRLEDGRIVPADEKEGG